jgi:hypothetical protein
VIVLGKVKFSLYALAHLHLLIMCIHLGATRVLQRLIKRDVGDSSLALNK